MRQGYPGMVTYQLRVQHDSGTIEDEVLLNENFLAKLFNLLTDISKSVPLLSTSENFETFFVPAGVLMIQQLNGQDVDDLYELVLSELEKPLLEEVMKYTRGNQTRAANLMGINRGTLRKKLKQYGMS